MAETRAPLKTEQVLAFHTTLSNWKRFGANDQLGTLNLITAEKRADAARLVQSGRIVSCARPLATTAAPDNPNPVVHLMTATATEQYGGDYFAIASHGFATSHIDALCHIFHDGKLYNGYPIEKVTAHGALELGIHELRDGIVSRGILLDIPRARGVPYLERGDPIFPDDLERAESECDVRVEPGDVLLVSTGRWAYRDAHGPWPASDRAPSSPGTPPCAPDCSGLPRRRLDTIRDRPCAGRRTLDLPVCRRSSTCARSPPS